MHTNQLVEFTHGTLEFLEVTTYSHQVIVIVLYELLQAFVRPLKDGRALVSPIRIRVAPGLIREPDVVYLTQQRIPKDRISLPDGADLVMEVVSRSDESRNRDLVLKRRDYASAGIPEYWVVDPESATVTVLTLDGDRYKEAGIYGLGEKAVSLRLPGFEVAVTEVMTAD